MASSKRRRILDIIATDSTFERTDYRGEEVWCGRCIFCNRRLYVAVDGTPISRATIEHMLPRNHGGTDDLENLALACAGCNREKGSRHDRKPRSDPRAREIIDRLIARRRARWR